jgi:hypothetical protein
MWNFSKDDSCRLDAHGVSSSLTWRQTVSPFRLASSVQGKTARGNIKNVSYRNSCRLAHCAKSEISSRSICDIPSCTISLKKEEVKPQSEELNAKPNNWQPTNIGRARSSVQSIRKDLPQKASTIIRILFLETLERAYEFHHCKIAKFCSTALQFETTSWSSLQIHICTFELKFHSYIRGKVRYCRDLLAGFGFVTWFIGFLHL